MSDVIGSSYVDVQKETDRLLLQTTEIFTSPLVQKLRMRVIALAGEIETLRARVRELEQGPDDEACDRVASEVRRLGIMRPMAEQIRAAIRDALRGGAR